MTKDQYLAAAAALLAAELELLKGKLGSGLDSLAIDIVNGRMGSDSVTRAEIDALLDRFSASAPDSFEHQKAADAVIAALHRYKRFAADKPTAPPNVTTPTEKVGKVPVGAMRSGPFYGMGIRDAVVEPIKANGKQTAREIWAALEAGGFLSAHEDPVHAVQNALVRRARTQKDVFLVGEGKWDLCSGYSDEERARIAESLNGQAGRDARLHRGNTSRGMRVAAARGARIGAKKKFDAEKRAKVEDMLRSGSTLGDAAKAVGVTRPTILNNISRERIYELRGEAERLKDDGPPEETRH